MLVQLMRVLVLTALLVPAAMAEASPTFTKDVAPIFVERCVSCHRPGEIAPMSLMTYEEVRPWAKAIRQKVANREMPPWDADPTHGTFRNDISLTQEQIDTILAWADAGAAQGNPADMPEMPALIEGWKLGEPDHVIEIEPFDVPADGEDIFISKVVRLDLPETRWIRAVEVIPGNRQVLHHLVSFKGYFEMGEGGHTVAEGVQVRPEERGAPDVFSIWAAGTPPTEYPQGMGHEFAHDQLVSFNIHYHPYGAAARDESKVGLYYGEGALEKQISTGAAINTGIDVAPNSRSDKLRASHVFPQAVQLVSFFPHMHQRGKTMTYELTKPSGETQTLLHVPDYNFNWQWMYYLEQPVDVPAGSRIDVYATWDNTESNPNNPDPTQRIAFGDGTNYEMHIGFFDYIPKEGRDPKPVNTAEIVEKILAMHPPEESYRLALGGMQGRGIGMHLPAEGDATIYVLEGDIMLTMTAHDVKWIGEGEAVFNAKVIRDAGRTIPFGVYANVNDPKNVTGHVYIGRPVPEKPDPNQAMFQITGQRAG